jgi:ParB family transcriptional regulator, chromosome partitioning protein
LPDVGKRRQALGRGIEALIPTSLSGSRELALDDIIPGQGQPRKRFDDEKLAGLADSMRSHGILQPLIVSGSDEKGKHRLIAGERRWQAARIAGLGKVPVIVRDSADASAMEIALVENIQRQDLDPLEEAAAFDRLIREFGLTQEDVAHRVGRSRPSITNTIRLLTLPSIVREALIAGDVTEGHARALLGLDNAGAIELALARVVKEDLNVRQTERLVASLREPRAETKPHSSPRSQPPHLRALEHRLRASLGTKVTVAKGRKSGRIVIEYYSDDDLQLIVDLLLPDASES